MCDIFTLVSFFYMTDLSVLIHFPCAVRSWPQTKWSAIHWTANRQITEMSPSLKANVHTHHASPKSPSSSVYLWLIVLPAEARVCASWWWSMGESPQHKVSSLKYYLSLLTSSCLSHKKLNLSSFQPCVYFSQTLERPGNGTDCLCKSRQQMCMHVLNDRSHKDVEKDRGLKTTYPTREGLLLSLQQ